MAPASTGVAKWWEQGASLRCDPLGRLHSVTDASGTEQFVYDGTALIAEYNAGGSLLRRHVHGLSTGDDPLASYEGTAFAASNEQLIRTDYLGSVTLMSTDRTTASVNTYDEYGVPSSGNVGRFQYQYTDQNRNRQSKNLDCPFKIASMRKLG